MMSKPPVTYMTKQPWYREKPSKELMPSEKKARYRPVGLRQDGPRRVEAGCIDVTKRESYYSPRNPKTRVVDINEYEGFCPGHDFQRDQKYLELSRKLSFFDIEVSKRIASGDTLSEICEQMFKKEMRPVYVGQRIARREAAITPLVEYFRGLLGLHRDPDTFSVEEAFRSMVTDIRAAAAGKERYALTKDFMSICGMGKQLAEYAATRIGKEEIEVGMDVEAMKRFAEGQHGAA